MVGDQSIRYYRSDCTPYIINHKQDPSCWMTPMKSSSELWKRTGNTSSNEWKGTRQHSSHPSPSKKGQNIPSTVPVIKTAGNDYRVVHISLIMAAGVAEVVLVMAVWGFETFIMPSEMRVIVLSSWENKKRNVHKCCVLLVMKTRANCGTWPQTAKTGRENTVWGY